MPVRFLFFHIADKNNHSLVFCPMRSVITLIKTHSVRWTSLLVFSLFSACCLLLLIIIPVGGDESNPTHVPTPNPTTYISMGVREASGDKESDKGVHHRRPISSSDRKGVLGSSSSPTLSDSSVSITADPHAIDQVMDSGSIAGEARSPQTESPKPDGAVMNLHLQEVQARSLIRSSGMASGTGTAVSGISASPTGSLSAGGVDGGPMDRQSAPAPVISVRTPSQQGDTGAGYGAASPALDGKSLSTTDRPLEIRERESEGPLVETPQQYQTQYGDSAYSKAVSDRLIEESNRGKP
jgi:hypothetical protein